MGLAARVGPSLATCSALLAAIAGIGLGAATLRAGEAAGPFAFVWTQSLPVYAGDPAINPIGGTEVRELAAFDDKLFAAVGYWMDSEENNPALPGAQVLRLDGPGSQWQVDFELTERSPWQPKLRRYFAFSDLQPVRFTTDTSGRRLPEPADLLLAGVWSRYPGLEAYGRPRGAAQWSALPVPGQENAPSRTQFRAFTVHRDRITGAEMVFAGASSAIFVGGYDADKRNVVWTAKPEWQGERFGAPNAEGRVMSFAECNGKLYATIYNAIYERIDGNAPVWKKVFETRMTSDNPHISGFRGLTAIANPAGHGEVLLAALEDARPRVFRIDPADPDPSGAAILELDVAAFLTGALGTNTTYAIVAYNKMTAYPDAAGRCAALLMGIEAKTPQYSQTFGKQQYYPRAQFIVRGCDGTYSLQQIRDAQVSPEPMLVATRSIAMSPFASDPSGTLYAGGFDANYNPVHNTAWIYKGVPAAAAALRTGTRP